MSDAKFLQAFEISNLCLMSASNWHSREGASQDHEHGTVQQLLCTLFLENLQGHNDHTRRYLADTVVGEVQIGKSSQSPADSRN